MRHVGWIVCLVLAVGGCSNGEPEATVAPPADAGVAIHGKKTAPVTIVARHVDERGAAVDVTFRRDARDVRVGAYGAEGLRVLSRETLVEDAGYRAGETASFDVAIDPGSAPGLLAVRVEGSFGGRPAFRVVTFAVGGPARAAATASPEIVEAGGERLRVTKARER